jgi:LAO/AO transport system kinase
MSGMADNPVELTQACQNGDRRAASRLISMLESSDQVVARAASDVVSRLPLPQHTIGITGPPGAGKSTLVSYVVELYRKQNEKVGVLAVDPSSPFTGGALLGDRIRMSNHRQDSGVFIRSMGSRGASGGLAAAASDSLRVLAAAGYQTIFLETIGAGQAETEVVNLADTVSGARRRRSIDEDGHARDR